MAASPPDRFEAIALPLAASMYRTAMRITGRREDAADLVQETYLRAFRTFSSFREGTNAKAWLFTILWSIASNDRSRRSRAGPLVSIDELEARLDRDLEIADWRGYRQMTDGSGQGLGSDEVTKALDDLPLDHRAVVVLVDLEDLSYEEAAAALGCPVGTVRSRLFRGRKALAGRLHDYARRMGFLERPK
jgi:RNA polymerase sigma-70 factor (ECF subfamily)